MSRPDLARILVTLLAVALVSIVGVMPPAAHAQSLNGRVWVVDDVTAQNPCTTDGVTTCPAGSWVVLHVYHVPVATAQAEHRPSVHADASQAELDAFVEAAALLVHNKHVATRSRPTLAGLARIHSRTCTANSPVTIPREIQLTGIGSPYPTIHANITYNTDSCGNAWGVGWSEYIKVSGHPVYSHNASNIYDGGGHQHDNFNGGWCDGIVGAYAAAASQTAFPKSGAHNNQYYSSGSGCNTFTDQFQAVDYWWGL